MDELPEAEAKKMANSLIRELSQQDDSHGFICREYDTAMCSWTSAMNKERNLTIHHCKGL